MKLREDIHVHMKKGSETGISNFNEIRFRRLTPAQLTKLVAIFAKQNKN